MKIYFDHILGKITDQQIFYSPATALFEQDEYEYAIQNGWHVAESWDVKDFDWYNRQIKDKQVWYQARSTRIKMSDFHERARHRKKIKKAGITCEYITDVSNYIDELWSVFKKYIEAKKFINFYNSKEDLFDGCHNKRNYLIYRNKLEKIIGFSIVEIISSSVAIAPQFAWDYEDPSIGLGSLNKFFQARLLKSNNVSHLYLGVSYEKSAISKSKWPGFEWWNGRYWSDNVEIYKKLLNSDTNTESLKEIELIQNEYYSNYEDKI